MNKLYQIKSEFGVIYVIIKKVNDKYSGKMFDSDIDINIVTPTLESCLTGLKNAFEIQLHFWLNKELLPIKIKLLN